MAKLPKCTYTRSEKNIAPMHDSNTYMQTQPSLPHNNTLNLLPYWIRIKLCMLIVSKFTFQLTKPGKYNCQICNSRLTLYALANIRGIIICKWYKDICDTGLVYMYRVYVKVIWDGIYYVTSRVRVLNLPITFPTERSAYLVSSENFSCQNTAHTLVDTHLFTLQHFTYQKLFIWPAKWCRTLYWVCLSQIRCLIIGNPSHNAKITVNHGYSSMF